MKIQKVKISRINPAKYNPRKDLRPEDPEYQKLLKSIDTFGYIDPLIWNKRSGNLVGGHQRLKILKAKGIKEVEVSVVDLEDKNGKALNIALNKISGDWDNDKLAALLDELIKEPNLDLSVAGFDLPEATKLIDDVLMPDSLDDKDFDIDSELSKIKKPVTKRGKVIELGPHRLLCGDSTKKSCITKLFGSKRPNIIFSDPPYGVDYVAIKNKASIQNDNVKHLGKLLKVVANIDCRSKYICGHWKTFSDYVKALSVPDTLIVWNKSQQSNSSMKGHNFHFYNPRHEFIFYYGSQKHKKGIYEENVWTIPNKVSINHPTIKPVSLCIRAIRNSSVKGDIVFDPFLGSGSTLIAAQRLGRRCFGIELEPKYCDVIVRRYIATAGKDAVSSEIFKKYSLQEVSK